ncbi:MAG: hypothetical protein AAGK01_08770 [Pseudomonadota bacterium]
MELTAILASLLLASQAQPAAETSATQSEPKAEQSAGDDEKIICRRTAITGSKFKKRICGTKKQWEDMANRGSDTTREFQRRGKGNEPVN